MVFSRCTDNSGKHSQHEAPNEHPAKAADGVPDEAADQQPCTCRDRSRLIATFVSLAIWADLSTEGYVLAASAATHWVRPLEIVCLAGTGPIA